MNNNVTFTVTSTIEGRVIVVRHDEDHDCYSIFETQDIIGVELGILRWTKGALIQDVLPMLNANEREFLITGFSSQEWLGIFGEDE
jgi:hypothetical protein